MALLFPLHVKQESPTVDAAKAAERKGNVSHSKHDNYAIRNKLYGGYTNRVEYPNERCKEMLLPPVGEAHQGRTAYALQQPLPQFLQSMGRQVQTDQDALHFGSLCH